MPLIDFFVPFVYESVSLLATNQHESAVSSQQVSSQQSSVALSNFPFSILNSQFLIDPCPILSHACPTGVVGQITIVICNSYSRFLPLSHDFLKKSKTMSYKIFNSCKHWSYVCPRAPVIMI